MSTEKVQHEYGADEIQILEGLEAVRKRPNITEKWKMPGRRQRDKL